MAYFSRARRDAIPSDCFTPDRNDFGRQKNVAISRILGKFVLDFRGFPGKIVLRALQVH